MELNITHIQHYLAYGLRVQYEGIINGAELKQWEKEFSDRYEINGIYPTRPCPEAIIGDKIGFIKRIEFRKNGSPSFLIGNKVGKRYYDLKEVKPLLLPISALYEEIDGEIGIVEIYKMMFIYPLLKDYRIEDNTLKFRNNTFEWVSEFNGFSLNGDAAYILLEVANYLDSKHYDWRYGLIDKGIAIDKRSVK